MLSYLTVKCNNFLFCKIMFSYPSLTCPLLKLYIEDPGINRTTPDIMSGDTGWELELLGIPSSNQGALAESKLVKANFAFNLDLILSYSLCIYKDGHTCLTHRNWLQICNTRHFSILANRGKLLPEFFKKTLRYCLVRG